MDLVTHSLVGVALSRAGLQRYVPNATLLLVLAATVPDIDYLARAAGPLAELENHRGYTHSLLFLPILAGVCVGLTALIRKEWPRWFTAWLIAGIGVASHLILDATGSVGIRPLLPFSARWLYLDLNGPYDGVLLAVFGFAFISPWFVNLVSGEIGRRKKQKGQGSALAALIVLLLYEAGRWSLHEGALNDLNARLYDGDVPLSVAALPQPNNPFEWLGVVETPDAFRTVRTGTLDLGDASDSRVFEKPAKSSDYRTAMQTEPFRYMAYFSRFPVWGTEPMTFGGGVGKLLDLTDLRFGIPGTGGFHAIALTNGSGRLLISEFSFSAGELKRIRNSPTNYSSADH